MTEFNLAQNFCENSVRFPDALALSVDAQQLTYRELRNLVQPVSRCLPASTRSEAPRVVILASRSIATFVGVLATAWAGGTYVPVSTKLPEERLIQLLEQIEGQAIIVDSGGLAALTERVLLSCPRLVLAPELDSRTAANTLDTKRARIITKDRLPAFDQDSRPVPVDERHVAYIIFTSGTTGIPKGVMITAQAVSHFVNVMMERYDLQPSDRVAGMTETTFDLSVFDMFVTWRCGASLFVVPNSQLMAPSGFVNRNECSVIFTVPSVIAGMQKMKMLRPGCMPSLRYSFFAGEPLPVASASQWKQAAPQSVVEDLFGPTEATVVCLGQRFTGSENATPDRGVVAIGTPFRGMEAAIVDASLRFLPLGERGELVLSGPQLSCGYFGAPELTETGFPVLAGKRWYRTGDLAYCDSAHTFHHLGRIDNQVKVRGLRVELEEIESYLRAIYQTDSVAALGWPMENGSANGIVAFVSGDATSEDRDGRAKIKESLPSYMVPSAIHRVKSLPLNANGKVDRQGLISLLNEGKF